MPHLLRVPIATGVLSFCDSLILILTFETRARRDAPKTVRNRLMGTSPPAKGRGCV